eukprot:2637281-Prymnesium_polylepis.1
MTKLAVKYETFGYHPVVGRLQKGYMPKHGLVKLYKDKKSFHTYELLGYAGGTLGAAAPPRPLQHLAISR